MLRELESNYFPISTGFPQSELNGNLFENSSWPAVVFIDPIFGFCFAGAIVKIEITIVVFIILIHIPSTLWANSME